MFTVSTQYKNVTRGWTLHNNIGCAMDSATRQKSRTFKELMCDVKGLSNTSQLRDCTCICISLLYVHEASNVAYNTTNKSNKYKQTSKTDSLITLHYDIMSTKHFVTTAMYEVHIPTKDRLKVSERSRSFLWIFQALENMRKKVEDLQGTVSSVKQVGIFTKFTHLLYK